jgi:hypothetical protein
MYAVLVYAVWPSEPAYLLISRVLKEMQLTPCIVPGVHYKPRTR